MSSRAGREKSEPESDGVGEVEDEEGVVDIGEGDREDERRCG